MEKGIKKYIGTKYFYKHVAIIITPIIIQQLLFSLGGYVDNLMVNAYGGNSIAYGGVSAANRLMLVFNFLFMGLAAASSIYLSQYFGAQDKDGIKKSFNLGWITAVIFGLLSGLAIHFFGDAIVDIFIQNEQSRAYGYAYLDVMEFGAVIWAINMSLATAFRTVKQTILPMVVGICGILMNTTLNYFLIFGHGGFPELATTGAAIATVSSRLFEVVVLLGFAIFSKKSYFKKFWKHMKLQSKLIKGYVHRGLPLVANELLWAVLAAVLVVFTTYKNDTWYTAYAYTQNISDLFFVFFAGLANGTAIILGPQLGVNNFEKAKIDAYRMNGLAIAISLIMMVLMVVMSPFILTMFSPTDELMQLSIDIIKAIAFFLPFYAYNTTCFFSLRAGGDSLRAFLLDQGATIIYAVPVAIILGVNSVSLGITVVEIYFYSHLADIFKIFLAHRFVEKGTWLRNLTIL